MHTAITKMQDARVLAQPGEPRLPPQRHQDEHRVQDQAAREQRGAQSRRVRVDVPADQEQRGGRQPVHVEARAEHGQTLVLERDVVAVGAAEGVRED